MAKIDVLLPVKNGIDYLAESLDSISDQTFKDWRLLVLDHGSNDGSRELAERYQERDSRVVVHTIPEADGLSGLLNRGLDLCDCKYVMRHDADDVAFPHRMETVLEAFNQYDDCVAIGGQGEQIDASGARTGALALPVGRDRVTAAFLFRNPLAHPASMMDFSAIQKHQVRYGVDFIKVLPPEQQIVVKGLAEDYFMFGQLAIMGKCVNIPAQLIKYRWHGGNESIKRFSDQMKISLEISRFLVQAFCKIHNLKPFDPAPFCNHGGILFDVDGKSDFSEEFSEMADTLRQGLGESEDLERELAFRRVVSTRQSIPLLWRYHKFQTQCSPETGEWNAVRSWLLRGMPGKAGLRVTTDE